MKIKEPLMKVVFLVMLLVVVGIKAGKVIVGKVFVGVCTV